MGMSVSCHSLCHVDCFRSYCFGHTVSMCGRYRLSRRKQILEEQFAAISDDADWSPRYNIAPTQFVPVIRRTPRSAIRELSLIRWGLVPREGSSAAWAANGIAMQARTTITDRAKDRSNSRTEVSSQNCPFCTPRHAWRQLQSLRRARKSGGCRVAADFSLLFPSAGLPSRMES